MDFRVGLVVLLVLAAHWGCNARYLVSPDFSGVEDTGGKVDMCSLCEEYTTLALNYLKETKTQAGVMEYLHEYCLQMHGLKEQCIRMVDQYASIFFSEVSSVQPDEFCKTVGLCKNTRMSSLSQKRNKCDLCHQAIDEVLVKLENPETKLKIIEMLLKACNSMDKSYVKKCKSMVFEYGPIILIDAEKFIKQADVCTKFHACNHPKAEKQELLVGKIEMVTST